MKPLVLPIPPNENHYLGQRCMRVRGKWIPHYYLTPEAKKYKLDARLLALAHGVRPIDGPVEVSIDVYRKWLRGDLTGFFKVAFDALQGIVYANDSQIVRLVATLGLDRENPRIVLSATEMK